MRHHEPEYEKNILRIITSEEDGYDLTVHYHRGQCLRSADRESEAEYGDDVVTLVEDDEGNTLTESEINALGLTDHDLINLQEHRIG